MKKRLTCFLVFLLGTALTAAHYSEPSRPAPASAAGYKNRFVKPRDKIHLGIDHLALLKFKPLRGKRAGLLTHPAGVSRNGVSTIEILRRAPGVKLTALFGPEHGIYGDEEAGKEVFDRTDPRTGLPVYSLYGLTRRPTAEMLAKIDVLVIDLQDIGARSYTFASAMRYAMEECFKHGVEVVVLDRPNPLGGLKVDGPMMEKRWMSYVGAFPVPYVHGLTIGELAEMAYQTPGWLEVDEKTRKRGRLKVIPMLGWKRSMMWPETGLEWVPTSPAIPDLSAAMGYPMTGLGGQIGGFSHGYGTPYPFRLLRYPGKTPTQIKRALEAKNIPGLAYKPLVCRLSKGRAVSGLYVLVTDWQVLRPTELSFHMMQLACLWERHNPFVQAGFREGELFNKHAGSTAWWEAIRYQGARVNVQKFMRQWRQDARRFQRRSRRFWIYP